MYMPDDTRAQGDTCYLCGEKSKGAYCFLCRRPVCDNHLLPAKDGKFFLCPFDAKEFYKPLFDLCEKMKQDATEKSIAPKKYLQCAVETLIERM
jgi:hypothetical protein